MHGSTGETLLCRHRRGLEENVDTIEDGEYLPDVVSTCVTIT